MKNSASFTLSRSTPATIGLVALLLLAQSSQGAVTITISGEPSSTTAVISLSGSLTLHGLRISNPALPVIFVTDEGELLDALGLTTVAGRPSSSPFSLDKSDVDFNRGSSVDTASITVTDSSNADAVLTSGFIDSMTWAAAGVYTLHYSTRTVMPVEIDAGDLMNFSGSFDFNLGADTFDSTFVKGTHVGRYNGQDVTIVVSSVPEPSNVLLGTCGLALAGFRRRR